MTQVLEHYAYSHRQKPEKPCSNVRFYCRRELWIFFLAFKIKLVWIGGMALIMR